MRGACTPSPPVGDEAVWLGACIHVSRADRPPPFPADKQRCLSLSLGSQH